MQRKTILHSLDRQIVLFSTLLIFLTHTVFAQETGSVKGKVVDETGEPLIGANILIQNTNIGTVSDLEGDYIIKNISVGRVIIRVSYLGYVTATSDIVIREETTLLVNFTLISQALEGETVVITAQARGQNAAINQQISSNTISNIVSQARIKELPDVNAAESIGRLPGISISRYNGEATGIDVRGLSPKYNIITVNGVTMPSTGADDRSVDLSLVSSNMLNGIEVKKANTPDMDAYVLGGTVDLQLKEAGDEPEFNASMQGGYNQFEKYYGNYNINVSGSGRLFDNDLGIVASLNSDKYNRGADKLRGSWSQSRPDPTNKPDYYISFPVNLQLDNEKLFRQRFGGSILLDYRLPNGKITSNFFYNSLNSDYLLRRNRLDKEHGSLYYDVTQNNDAKTSIFTGSLGLKQDFGWIEFDMSLARTGTRSEDPEDRQWTFAQENSGIIAPQYTPYYDIPKFSVIDSTGTAFSSAYIYKRLTQEHQSTAQLNIKIPFVINTDLSGYFKLGGKFKGLTRMYDQNQNGRDGLQYGSSTGLSDPLSILLKALAKQYPDRWNFERDSALVRRRGWFPITAVLSGTERSNFLNGQFQFAMSPDINTLNQITDAWTGTSAWLPYSIGTLGRDYSGVEEFESLYLMNELNIGSMFTIIPGVRWEQSYSKYNGQQFREATVNNTQGPPAGLTYITKYRRFDYLLPYIHVIFKPTDNIKVRLARTETLTQPDYQMYAPITSINTYQSYIRAAQSNLRPAHSKNYDASISFQDKYAGFFSVSGFQKTVNDLILQSSIYGVVSDSLLPEGLNVNHDWWPAPTSVTKISPQVDSYFNNPNSALYRGVELEWQSTTFWFLPSLLQGIVFNVNYTKIFSETKLPFYEIRYDSTKPFRVPGSRVTQYPPYRFDTSRTSRVTGQPDHIINLSFGYDYMGFSIRTSYLFQTDKISFIGVKEIQDQTSAPYERWDLSIQQKLDYGIQIYTNINNINKRRDTNYLGDYSHDHPTYFEYYGLTADIGLRIVF